MATLLKNAQASNAKFHHIPIIDIAHISSTNHESRLKLAHEVRNAFINHSIPEDVIKEVLLMSKKFFALPSETKMMIENKKTPNFKGYSPLLSGNNDPENKGDLQEGFELGWEDFGSYTAAVSHENDQGVMTGKNVWPPESEVPGFQEAVLSYYHSAVQLGRLLFPLFALALDQPEDFFEDRTRHSAALMKLLHYPPQPEPSERVMGIGAHTDWECFTILWQEPGIQALQVQNSEKQWVDAPPIPGTLVINIGDQLARWTNDVFKSTVHRAINRSGARRYSIPLFFGTDYNVKLEPIPSCVSPERPAKYDVVTAGEYVKARLQATYNH